MYQIVFTRRAMKDRSLIAQAGLEARAKSLLSVLANDPYQSPPPYEKLVGDLSGFYSRRINGRHRLVYSVDQERQTVKILRLWTHYE